MRNGTYIGLSLGDRFIPYDLSLSSFWGGETFIADNAIRRAQSAEKTRRYEAMINSNLMTRFSRRVMQRLMQEADAIRSRRKDRDLTRAEQRELDGLLDQHRKYYERFEYYLSKLDRSAEAEVSRHFWYYDAETGEAVDADTGIRYTA